MSADKRNSSENTNMCVVCFKNVDIYSIGVCDHPVCFECSTRMRVLCRQKECPICRQDMPNVIFCHRVELFKALNERLKNYRYHDHKFGVIFQNSNIKRFYLQLLEHNCSVCNKFSSFPNFHQLKQHMQREHELFYCDLCVENLRIFTWERKAYSRSDLSQHRRKGDTDDTSHRGHPLCKFCDTRYMDSDELFRHLRRDHLFCHFCDADGLHQYYASYDSLRQHFLTEHYLCEEGNCIHEKFTSVFRSDIDLKAHRASVHGKYLSKANAKQARTLELEFTLAPRYRPEAIASKGGKKPQASSSNAPDRPEGAVGYDVHMKPPEVPRKQVTLTAQDFPTLGGATAPVPPRPPGGLTIRHVNRGQQALARTEENFPALTDTGTIRLSVNSTISSPERPQTTSIHVNHRANGAITTHISQNSNTFRVRPSPVNDFPALSTANIPEVQWIKPVTVKEVKPKVSKVAPAPVLPSRDSPTDFPSLNKAETKGKKSNSVTVPVASAWVHPPEQKEKLKDTKSVSNSLKEKENVKNVAPTVLKQSENKDKLKNKKKKSKNPSSNNSSGNESTTNKKPVSAFKSDEINSKTSEKEEKGKKETKTLQQNGFVKKRSELKIDSLHVTDPCSSNGHEDFSTLGSKKPPPGFSVQSTAPPPPPGFSVNDLTFTNSSGQSYSILPQHQFKLPINFSQRNITLVDKLKTVLQSEEAIIEFKVLSELFRNGSYTAQKFYEHCQHVMGKEFKKMFSELLVLLPDIDKQQDLYNIHCRNGASKNDLEICATCRQVLSSSDKCNHLSAHTLDNHFPSLTN